MGLLEIFERVTAWLESSARHNSDSIDGYLVIIEEVCEQLIELKPGIDDESRLLQERVRALYADAHLVLYPRLSRDDMFVVLRALASARIFYWIRVLDLDSAIHFGSLEELRQLITVRGGPSGRSSSFTIVEHAIHAMCPDADPTDDQEALTNLRSACIRDFGQLQALPRRERFANGTRGGRGRPRRLGSSGESRGRGWR